MTLPAADDALPAVKLRALIAMLLALVVLRAVASLLEWRYARPEVCPAAAGGEAAAVAPPAIARAVEEVLEGSTDGALTITSGIVVCCAIAMGLVLSMIGLVVG